MAPRRGRRKGALAQRRALDKVSRRRRRPHPSRVTTEALLVRPALAAHGGGITAEAADIVLLADDVTRVADAIAIGRRATQIARQSIFAGLLLSGAAMVVAALGYIPPTIGALLQEAIDIAVILNALRAGTGPASDIP